MFGYRAELNSCFPPDQCRHHGGGQQANWHRQEAPGDGEGGGGGERPAGGLRHAVSYRQLESDKRTPTDRLN